MKKILFSIGALSLMWSNLLATDESSSAPPMGYSKLEILGKTDNVVSLPLARQTVFYALVASCTPTSVTLADVEWLPKQFTFVSGKQNTSYAVEFITRNLKGISYRITDNTQDTLSLDTNGDDLTEHRRGAIQAGDLVSIRPYWSVGDIFGADDAHVLLNPVETSPTLDEIEAVDCILIPDNTSIGIEKPYSLSMAYVQESGWRKAGDSATDVGHAILPVGLPFVVHRQGGELETVFFGSAPRNTSINLIKGGDGTHGNDTYAALALCDPISLDSAGLVDSDGESSVIQGSDSILTQEDELLVFDPADKGFHREPKLVFYYADGSWRQLGNPSSTVGQDFLLQPGTGFIIRKRSANLNQDWVQLP